MMRKLMTPRAIALILVIAALIAVGIWLRTADVINTEKITSFLDDLGLWAVPGFWVLFTIGGLVPIPGMVFIAASRLVFGPALGFVAAYVGALLAVTAAFLLVRSALRGAPKKEIRLPYRWAQKLLDGAEHRPVISVALLRLVFGVSPPLNYGLGFTQLKTRHYVGGSAVGLLIPVAFITFAAGLL